jgi:hypothetical protein
MIIRLCLSGAFFISIVSCSTPGNEVKQSVSSDRVALNDNHQSKFVGMPKAEVPAKVEEAPEVVSPPKQEQTPLGMVVELYPFPFDRLPAAPISGSLDMNLKVCKGRKLSAEQKKYCDKMGRISVRPEGGAGDYQSYFIWDRKEECYLSSFRGVQETPGRLKIDNQSPVFQERARATRPKFLHERLDNDMHGRISVCFKNHKPISLALSITNPVLVRSGPYGVVGQPPTSDFVMKAEGKEFSVRLDPESMLIDVRFNGKMALRGCAMDSLYEDPSGGGRAFKENECHFSESFNGQISGSIKGKAIPMFND